LIVGQRVPPGEGVCFRATSAEPIHFLQSSYWKKNTGEVFDLVSRKGRVIDMLPWFEEDGNLFVLARRNYPRPILSLGGDTINDARRCDWVTEPLNVVQSDRPIGIVVEEVLARFLDVNIKGMDIGSQHFPSPGGLMECIQSVQVEIDSVLVDKPMATHSGFSTSGTLRSIEARQLLRAAQVGALPDARLELYVYALLQSQNRGFGDWIGAQIPMPVSENCFVTPWEEVLNGQPRRVFSKVSEVESQGFLNIVAHNFAELDSESTVINTVLLESIALQTVSDSTISCALLRQVNGEIAIGVAVDDFPAAQCFVGASNLPVAPAWRLPKSISGSSKIQQSLSFVSEKIHQEYQLVVSEMIPLGGRYHPAPGLTPEVVHPYAVLLEELQPESNGLVWVSLTELVENQNQILDGHLRLLSVRLDHALS
jgi:hypothetical protein